MTPSKKVSPTEDSPKGVEDCYYRRHTGLYSNRCGNDSNRADEDDGSGHSSSRPPRVARVRSPEVENDVLHDVDDLRDRAEEVLGDERPQSDRNVVEDSDDERRTGAKESSSERCHPLVTVFRVENPLDELDCEARKRDDEVEYFSDHRTMQLVNIHYIGMEC